MRGVNTSWWWISVKREVSGGIQDFCILLDFTGMPLQVAADGKFRLRAPVAADPVGVRVGAVAIALDVKPESTAKLELMGDSWDGRDSHFQRD